ncbi:hypothetical protein D3C85_1573930 [compost metagenome]
MLVMHDGNEIPPSACIFENQSQTGPIHSLILWIEARKMILNSNIGTRWVNAEHVIGHISFAYDGVVADLRRSGEVGVIDKFCPIIRKGEINRITGSVKSAPMCETRARP